MPTLIERFAEFAADRSGDDIPTDVRATASRHLLDAVGCGIAAGALGEGVAARDAAAVSDPAGPCTAIGLEHGLPAAEAALVNGSLCHALDYDDTHAGSICHVTTVVGPAALAVAESLGRSGTELLDALVIGNEIVARIGALGAGALHDRGFHPTPVCGAFGAAAAAARLAGADARTTAHALGIAGSMASGLLAFLDEGVRTKAIHAGWAAHAGVSAARLALHGGEGATTAIEGRLGLLASHLGGVPPEAANAADDLGEVWETLAFAIKPYPACHFLHAHLECAAELRGGESEEIVALVPGPGIPVICEPAEAKRAPRTPYEAKFSLQFSVAAMLIRGEVDLATYDPDSIAAPDVLELAARVRYEAHDFDTFPGGFPGALRIRSTDGTLREATCEHQPGHPQNPLAPERVRDKLRRNAVLGLPEEVAEALAALEDFEDLAALTRPLRRATPLAAPR